MTTDPVSEFWNFQTGAAEGPIIRRHAGTSLDKKFLTFRQNILIVYSREQSPVKDEIKTPEDEGSTSIRNVGNGLYRAVTSNRRRTEPPPPSP